MRQASKKLTTRQLKQLANLTDTGSILATLHKLNWTIEESIGYIVQIARDASKEATRLNAIRYLNQLVMDTMERSGLTVIATHKVVGEDGEELSLTGHVVSSILRDQSERTSAEELYPAEQLDKENADGLRKTESTTNPESTETKNGTTEGTSEGQLQEEEKRTDDSGSPPDETPDRPGLHQGSKRAREESTDLGSCKPPEGRGVLTGNFPGISNNGPTRTGNLRDYFPAPESELEDPDA